MVSFFLLKRTYCANVVLLKKTTTDFISWKTDFDLNCHPEGEVSLKTDKKRELQITVAMY